MPSSNFATVPFSTVTWLKPPELSIPTVLEVLSPATEKPFRLIVIPDLPTTIPLVPGQLMLLVSFTLLVTVDPQTGFAAATLGAASTAPPNAAASSIDRPINPENALFISPHSPLVR